MPERINTKAVLADCLPPNPANYKSDFQCMTIAIKRLEAIRGALAQEITDREALEKACGDALWLVGNDADRHRLVILGHITARPTALIETLRAALAKENP